MHSFFFAQRCVRQTWATTILLHRYVDANVDAAIDPHDDCGYAYGQYIFYLCSCVHDFLGATERIAQETLVVTYALPSHLPPFTVLPYHLSTEQDLFDLFGFDPSF